MKRLIALHTEKYPLMQPTDAVKLVYQRELGCGHLLPAQDICATRIDSERAELSPDATYPAAMPLGNGLMRLDLRCPDSLALPAPLIAKMMAQTADRVKGTNANLISSLQELMDLTEQGLLPFDAPALKAYLTDYVKAGYPMVSHSERYRAAYKPAYRVVDAGYAALLGLIHRIEAHPKPVTVVIDGPCAAGKSTAARLLGELFGASVFHMDDYFLPPDMRTQERLKAPGGNVHHERFLSEVLLGLQSGAPFAYQPYSCQTGQRRMEKAQRGDVTIIEGAYSLHPSFSRAYQAMQPITVFLDVSPLAQKARLLARNGAEMFSRFEQMWIPLEKSYFEAYHIRERAGRTLAMEDETV